MTRDKRRPAAARRGPRMPKPDRLVLGLIGLALALRLWGLADHLPDPSFGIDMFNDSSVEETDRTTIGRAWSMWHGGTKQLDLNPHTSGWPALSFYVTLGIQAVYRGIRLLFGDGADPRAFFEHVMAHADSFFLFGRAVSALIGVLTVVLAYRLGARLLGRAGGLVAGALLAANTLHILTSQHVSDPNLLALLFVLLAAFPLVRLAERVTVRDAALAGAMIGLAGACKYVPLVLAAPLLAALLLAAPPPAAAGSGSDSRRSRWVAPAAGLGAIAAALVIATPYTFLDLKTTLRDVGAQRRALFSDWVGQTEFPISLPTYFTTSLPHAMGWPAYVLGLVGLALMIRGDRRRWIIGAIPLVLIGASGLLKSAQERYVLVALPFLFIGAAAALLALRRGSESLLARRGAAPSPLTAVMLPALLGAVAMAWTIPEYAAIRRSLALPDSRHLARRWIQAEIPPKTPFGLELYGPVFRPEERAYVMWPFFATRVPLVRPAFRPEWLDGLRYYVASGEISRRFIADSASYPVETAYYRWLTSHTSVVWRSDPATTSGPRLEVLALPERISTRAERDSLFARLVPEPVGTQRLGLWCLDMSRVFLEQGQDDRAEEWARRGIQIGAVVLQPRLYVALCEALLRLDRPDSTETIARLAQAQYPENYIFRVYRGIALHRMHLSEEAVVELETALRQSGDPQVRITLGGVLESLGHYREAIAVLEGVPADHPGRALARRNMGVLFATRLGRRAEALDALQESIRLKPGQPDAAAIRAEISRLGGPP